MNKAHRLKKWKNWPNIDTPVNAQSLDELDVSVDVIDDRVITLEETKATKLEVSEFFQEISFEQQTGIITFVRKNGATVTIDTPTEKIQTGIYYNPDTEKLVLPLVDGTSMEVDLSRLMKFDEFVDSDTIAFSVNANGVVTAIVKEGSIQEKHLRPDYLADIKLEVAKAEESKKTASEKSYEASVYSTESKSYACGNTGTREGESTDNAKFYKEKAEQAAESAADYLADLQSVQVTGVKGNAESAYRKGNVNITPDNIGAIAYAKITHESSNDLPTVLNQLDNPQTIFGDKFLKPYCILLEDAVGDTALGGGVTAIYGYAYISDQYGAQLGIKFGSPGNMYFRAKNAGIWTHWRKVYDSINKPTTTDIGAVSKTGDTMSGELKMTYANPLRFIRGDYGCIFRMDNNYLYILCTPEGSPNGNWTNARPIMINYKTGECNINGKANYADYINVTRGNEIRFGGDNGSNETLWFNFSLPNSDNATTKLKTYLFGNGQRGTEGVTLQADYFSGKASSANTLVKYSSGTVTSGSTKVVENSEDGDYLIVIHSVTNNHNYDDVVYSMNGYLISTKDKNIVVKDGSAIKIIYPSVGMLYTVYKLS